MGFAVTDHAAQSRTVTAGLAVIAGTEDRQHTYVALSRGTEVNMVYVFTVSPRLADPMPGPRPAPELARYGRITAEHAVRPAAAAAETRDALAVLSGVLDRNGQQLSASQTRQQALADADHLAILQVIWTDQTAQARPDVRGMPAGTLLHLRDTYPIETAWAPPYVGDQLRQVRAAAHDARLAGLRAAAEVAAARHRGDHDTAARQQELAASYQALHEAYRQRETVFAATMADRTDWDAATAPSATWPSPPTPNCAAATLASTTRHYAPPNPTPLRTASAPSSPSPRGTRRAR